MSSILVCIFLVILKEKKEKDQRLAKQDYWMFCYNL